MDSVFDLLDQLAAQQRLREFEQRAAAMPDWEKQFLLGFLKYTEAHPEVMADSQCSGFGCVDTCADCDVRGCDDCGIGHTIQKCPAIRKELFA